MMKNTLRTLLLVGGFIGLGANLRGAQADTINGAPSRVTIDKKVVVGPASDEVIERRYRGGPALVKLAIEDGGWGDSFLISGKVVSNNSGSPWEFLPLFVGYQDQRPYLAALTDAHGEFCFRVSIANPHPVVAKVKRRLDDGRFAEETIVLTEATGRSSGGNGHSYLSTLNLEESTLYMDGDFDGSKQMITSDSYPISLRGRVPQKAPAPTAATPAAAEKPKVENGQ